MCKGGNITKPLLWTQYDGPTIMSQHNSDLPSCHSTILTYHHVTAQFWPTIMSQHSSDLPSCHRTVLTYHNVTAQFWPTIMSQHNSISPQLSLILIREHASGTFIYTPRHTRANGKVAGTFPQSTWNNYVILSMKYIHIMPEGERI